MRLTSDATLVWRLLNGVATVYKPAGVTVNHVRNTIRAHLCRDLNDMEVRPQRDHVYIEGDTTKEMTVTVGPSYADHPLLIGPRYQMQDIKMNWVNHLGKDTSGVLILGINRGVYLAHKMKEASPTRFYRVKGVLGTATDNFFSTGKIVEKSTWRHVRRITIDKICASMQASHQRKMFELSGVDMQSQAAYDLATKGLIRPANSKVQMIYAIKCIVFNPPEFILEIVCMNEDEMYLKNLVHQLGVQLHSTATCTQVQCFQYGLFDTKLALLKKHWDLQRILDNMKECGSIIENNQFLLDQQSPILVEQQA